LNPADVGHPPRSLGGQSVEEGSVEKSTLLESDQDLEHLCLFGENCRRECLNERLAFISEVKVKEAPELIRSEQAQEEPLEF
jgi:hypothetical protein